MFPANLLFVTGCLSQRTGECSSRSLYISGRGLFSVQLARQQCISLGKEGQCIYVLPVNGPLCDPSLFDFRPVSIILCILILIRSFLLTLLYLSEPSSSLRIYRIPYRRHIEYSLQPDDEQRSCDLIPFTVIVSRSVIA